MKQVNSRREGSPAALRDAVTLKTTISAAIVAHSVMNTTLNNFVEKDWKAMIGRKKGKQVRSAIRITGRTEASSPKTYYS